jgi:hypothetical protein
MFRVCNVFAFILSRLANVGIDNSDKADFEQILL